MMLDLASRRRPGRRHLLFAVALAGVLSLALAVGRSVAGPNDPLNPFSAFTDSGPMTQEEKERRQQQRDSLYDRLSPDYRMSVPFVSEAAVSGLQLAIERYSRIVAAGGWPSLSGKVTLRYGDSGTEITAISTRLVMEGDLPPGAEAKSTFDDEFRDGLVRFQIRNGLRVTGFVDTRTLRELNVPATERQQQLQMNLPRLQELMKINKEARYVLVNVPSYTAQAVQGGQLALDSAVVVGKPQRATPQLTAKVVEVNFYPTWSVPESVAAKDLIPTIRKNPNYFYEQRFNVMRGWNGPVLDASQVDWASPEVVSYKFRQDPGPQNALGLVRINMPNKHAVYMHDTPLKALFSSQTRAFSSGCVRVERVLELVAWLLSDQGWSLPKVQAEIESGKQLNVKLKRAVPVHFVYLTAYASPNGLAQFRPDIYGRDASFGTLDEQEDAIIVQESRAVTP